MKSLRWWFTVGVMGGLFWMAWRTWGWERVWREAQSSAPAVEQEKPASAVRRAEPVRKGEWEELQDVRLVEHGANDGDSFVVKHKGGQHTFRIYYADSCEKYKDRVNVDRLADQGKYFGGLPERRVLELGAEAKVFTLDLLEHQPFMIYTKWEPVYDSGRFYAHVSVAQPDGAMHWLPEVLVQQGLARIHTKGEPLPDGTPMKEETARLKALERNAKRAGRGAWRKG